MELIFVVINLFCVLAGIRFLFGREDDGGGCGGVGRDREREI